MKLRSADWNRFGLWVLGLAVAALLLAAFLRIELARQVTEGAVHTGAQWARLLEQAVPDLPAALGGQGVSPALRSQLLQLGPIDGLVGFVLCDPRGLPMVSSEALKAGPQPQPPPAKPAARGEGAAAAAAPEPGPLMRQVLAGRPQVRSEPGPLLGFALPLRSVAYLPLVYAGAVVGVVEAQVEPSAPVRAARASLLRLAGGVALLLAALLGLGIYYLWRRLHGKRGDRLRAHHLAQHDALSGALNRAHFMEVLKQAAWRRAEGGPPFSLLCIDLDDFRDINDSWGHAVGDEVLRAATQRLKLCVRESDAVARLGGDEFAVLVVGVHTVAGIVPLARRVIEALARPHAVEGQALACSASVGIAIHGLDAREADELLGKADLAMYRAKAQGRGSFAFYDVAMDRQMQARRALARDLREALPHHELLLHYQPLYAADGRTLCGYEALLRWRHPVRGIIPPAEFIGLAEETGRIDTIGLWVLRRACAEAARWPQPLTVAVNLSTLQFVSADLVELVRRALADAGLAPARLVLEITESMLLHNTEQVMAMLQGLSAMGVAIAMDDFGTGYSSLAYLWRFPFHKLKIDRAFTQALGQDPKVDVIVQSIISLAHALGIRVNAEGVETPQQMAALQQRGCDELQGFLLGEPVPAEQLPHLRMSVPEASPSEAAAPPAGAHAPAPGMGAGVGALFPGMPMAGPLQGHS